MSSTDPLMWLVDWKSDLEQSFENGCVQIQLDAVQNETYGQCVNWRLSVNLTNVPRKLRSTTSGRQYTNQEKWVFFRSEAYSFVGTSGPCGLVALMEAFQSAAYPKNETAEP